MARKASERRSPTGHVGAVLALAVSSDGAFLASGGADMAVIVWNPEFLQGACVHACVGFNRLSIHLGAGIY